MRTEKITTVRNKCDKLLTPIIKRLHPYCEACVGETQVAHHWIEKSRSTYLRYDVERNLIPLCHSCHAKIHNRFGNSVTGSFDVATIIVNKRGKKWKNQLDIDSAKTVKADVYYFLEHLNRLQNYETY